MVVLQRKQLRHDLGLRHLGGTLVGTSSLSLGANASLAVLDRLLADAAMSGEELHQRSWLRVASIDYRVGSFNAASGAFLSIQSLINAVPSGADFEIQDKLHPNEMNRALDETIAELRVLREVALPTIDGAHFYTLDGAASPNTISDVRDVYYFANPGSSVNRDRRNFQQHQVVTTMSGIELRIPGGLAASQQIAVLGLLQLTLAGGDAATINLPDEEVVLWGAAARCYDLLIADSPGQQSTAYERRRKEAARMFTHISKKKQESFHRSLGFEQPFVSDPVW